MPSGVTAWGRILTGLATRLYKLGIIPCQADTILGDDEYSLAEYGILGRVIHTPGHSAGSICVLLDSGEVYVGDMAMQAWFLRWSPGLPVLVEDMSLVVQSWKKLIRMGAKRVYPAHGSDFPVEVIQKEILAFESRKGLADI